MTTFFTADEHYRSRSVCSLSKRPFADEWAMEETFIQLHNEVVHEGDEVYHLGDFSFDDRTVGQILSRLRGTHHLVPGNHDPCHASHRRWKNSAGRYIGHGFASVTQEVRLHGFVLNHLPYFGDSHHGEDRFLPQRPKDDGLVLLHGHVHEKWKVRGRMINVGVDVWDYAPVSLEEIAAFVPELRNSAAVAWAGVVPPVDDDEGECAS